MNRLLVIAEHPRAVEALKILLPPPGYGFVHLERIEQLQDSLPPSFIDGCLLDSDLIDAGSLRAVQAIRRRLPDVPLFVCAGQTAREWEEDAMLNGVSYVFRKPLRGPLLNSVLARALNSTVTPAATERAQQAAVSPLPTGPISGNACLSTLEILRDFSRLFTHSLHFRNFLHEFVLKLREVISVNRIALFLHRPQSHFLPTRPEDGRRLPCACSVGIAADLYRYFELSLDTGIGAAMASDGRILKADATHLLTLEAQREFEILGGQIAIPILDRERLLGIAVLGGRLTGLRLSDQELQLLFHLMEELGLAIKNSWLHDQLSTNHDLLANVLGQMSGGCLVVSRDLTILQANPAFLRLLQLNVPAGLHLEFADLPQSFASSIYEVLNSPDKPKSFEFSQGGRLLQASITPFRPEDAGPATAALVTVEDHTLIEAAKKMEMAAASDRLIRLIAEKFAHEIRNALVPLETHRQLLATSFEQPEFRQSLQSALNSETTRILRSVDQLAYISRQECQPTGAHPLGELLHAAAEKAASLSPVKPVIVIPPDLPDAPFWCEPKSLQHAFFEVILNGLQSRPDKPAVTIRARLEKGSDQQPAVLYVGMSDTSAGIPAEIATRAFEPFFTTRNVGLGLGLTVARKILRDHGGDVVIHTRPHQSLGDIVFTIPVFTPNPTPPRA